MRARIPDRGDAGNRSFGAGVRKEFEDKVDSVVRRDGTTIAKARFAQSGFIAIADATFTLRLSYGAVKGYQENGKTIPFATNIGGCAYQHAAEHGDKAPYHLPESWMKANRSVDLKTPLNFVSTADIIGGNSGSPPSTRRASWWELSSMATSSRCPGTLHIAIRRGGLFSGLSRDPGVSAQDLFSRGSGGRAHGKNCFGCCWEIERLLGPKSLTTKDTKLH